MPKPSRSSRARTRGPGGRPARYRTRLLRGFQKMLADLAIDVVQVEASMRRVPSRELSLQDFTGYLGPMGYHLFGLYAMQRSYRGMPVLGRIDPVFISTPVMESNIRT